MSVLTRWLGAWLVLAHGVLARSTSKPSISAAPGLEALERRAQRHLQVSSTPLLVVLGATEEARALVPDAELAALEPDAFLLRARKVSGRVVVACAGRTPRAVGFAFYELLQQLGFGFLHPLKPVIPEMLRPAWPLDVREAPRWTFRGTHYHTQHPLELTNFLNGYDAFGSTASRETWREAWPGWEDYLDWLLAQKQNYLEWMLLADSGKATGFEVSDERRERLRLIVDSAHDLGLEVGADVPLILKQQHALNLLPNPSRRRPQNAEQVRGRVQWLLSCGFDHLGTELGSTEFTRGLDAVELVHLLNVTQEELGSRKVLVKNHCSTKQTAHGFRDPRPDKHGEPLNFNYLNYYADAKIVSMPHTVQAYSLTDPAPTYGNTNFSDLRDSASFLKQQGRPVVFYPETAYWVNYDISVPLFLAPTYASDRLEDADTLDAMPGTAPILGQLNFESGWQWGYWLANSMQALAAWRRPEGLREAFAGLLRFLPEATRSPLSQLLVEFAAAQRRLLIEGRRADGVQTTPAPGAGQGSATGIAYLQGSEGLSDLASLVARYLHEGAPQPDRLHFAELRHEAPAASLHLLRALGEGGAAVAEAFWGSEALQNRRTWYQEQLRPLLQEVNATFASLAQRFASLPPAEPRQQVVQDLADAAQLLSLRCSQVLSLYEYTAFCSSGTNSSESTACRGHLAASRMALRAAQALVSASASRLGLEALGSGARRLVLEWSQPVPTAYAFGYLWAAQTLFYWRRDQRMVEAEIADPCFGTINDPVELGLSRGGGPWMRWAQSAVQSVLSNRLWHTKLSGCLGPREEPKLPGPDQDYEDVVVL